jgi:hypothetical protein
LASVLVLDTQGADEAGDWLPPVATAVADGGGDASFADSPTSGCCFAWRDGESALLCSKARGMAPDGVHMRLAPGVRISVTLSGPDGAPPAGARVRIAVWGAEERHYVEGAVGSDGVVRLPPIPEEAIRNHETRVEVRAPGFVEAHAPVSFALADQPIELRLVRARRAHGRIHSEDPVTRAVVHTADRWEGPRAIVAEDGTFLLDRVAPETRRLYVHSKSHASRIVELPELGDAVDLGVVELERGRPVRGNLDAAEPSDGGTKHVGVLDDDGVALDWCGVSGAGPFEIPHVGAGADRLAARVGDTGGELWLFERGKLGGDLRAPPFEMRFVRAPGRPTLLESGRVVWTDDDRKETIPLRVFPNEWGVAVVRLRLPGPGALRVEIPGAKPVVLDHVDVDADGRGSARVVVEARR